MPLHLSPTDVHLFAPTATPAPPPLVLGAQPAPPEEQEQYLSTTVVVAPVGEHDGEIGYLSRFVPQLSLLLPAEGPLRTAAALLQPGRTQNGSPKVLACPSSVVADRFSVDTYGNIYILDRANDRVAQFDGQGSFLRNAYYDQNCRYPEFLAVGPSGEICLYDEDGCSFGKPGVSCYQNGQWHYKYPRPSWLSSVRGMGIDADGTVWLDGEGSYPGAFYLRGYGCCIYSNVTVPIGRGGELFDEREQQELALPGSMLPSGGAAIGSSHSGTPYLYDRQGNPTHQLPQGEWLVDIDPQGDFFTMAYGQEAYYVVHKYDPQGRLIARIEVARPRSGYSTVLVYRGAVYALFIDHDSPDAYRVIRWEKR